MQHCPDSQLTSPRPDARLIKPLPQVDATISVPGSKSLTQRALLAAALARGVSHLHNPLASEDTHYTMNALRAMGIVCDDSDARCWLIHGQGGMLRSPGADIFLGNNGTATRFLTSVAALGTGMFRITGSKRLQERPLLPLIEALRGWDVSIESEANNGCLPVQIQAQGIEGGHTVLMAGQSSQYLSSLLLVAPYARKEAEIEVRGPILSSPYVAMTLQVMAAFGAQVAVLAEHAGLHRFKVPVTCYQAQNYAIEGDMSSASYFWAAAAITGGRATVANVSVRSCQGDKGFLPLLARMGCTVRENEEGVTVTGCPKLNAVEADMGSMPDVALTLAIVAAFAEGRSVISNIAHLRVKESDRLNAVVTELRRLGAEVEEEPDQMIIHGREGGTNLHGARIRTYNDHRMAMAFAVAGLLVPGVEIETPDCVAKSFPDFWQCFERLYTKA